MELLEAGAAATTLGRKTLPGATKADVVVAKVKTLQSFILIDVL